MPADQQDVTVIAVPKGRILAEALPLLARAGVVPEAAFSDENSRALRFATQDPRIALIRVRAFDVATFVAHGAAQLGIVGSDVLAEFDYPELYAPVDLGIGHCRLSVAEPADLAANDDPRGWSHVRVATKYPHLTAQHFARRGVQAECIKLNGAMELAPLLGLAPRIVDLVSSGRTLKENGLVEVEPILDVSARLVVNRAAMKTRAHVFPLVEAFRRAAAAAEVAA
ncbi:ATP phosphoribosyltransferase [Sphingomonas sp. RHCKR47]|jgi:ATP phosphoribosyltransferase|uniref:ATP phosphoribosyltransferase n=1 Tax=Sphingomonas citricola TaxID=2862498 RepID=UPI001CA4B746|nr:ATP phosphoribosyltransferase [Sphingomonas citricola]MBW6524678.1 ATP phosphoribosyltransferase [Sphingomonas citricola]